MAKRAPTNEELQEAVANVFVEFDGASPSARSVRKVIETNNPAWRVPPGRRVAKFVKKHELAVRSSSTVSSEEDAVPDEEGASENVPTPPVASRRSLLALGASLSVRRLLSGGASNGEPRREFRSKLSFRKKKLAGKRPSLTHSTGHEEEAAAPAAEPAPAESAPIETNVANVSSSQADTAVITKPPISSTLNNEGNNVASNDSHEKKAELEVVTPEQVEEKPTLEDRLAASVLLDKAELEVVSKELDTAPIPASLIETN